MVRSVSFAFSVVVLCGGCAAGLADDGALADFGSKAALDAAVKGDVKVSAAKSPDAAAGAAWKLDFADANNPSLLIKPEVVWDWSAAAGLNFRAFNAGNWPVTFTVRVLNGNGDKAPKSWAVVSIPAHGGGVYTVDFSHTFAQPKGVRGRIPELGPSLYVRGDKVDLAKVTGLSFGVDAWAKAETIYLSDVKVLPAGTGIAEPAAVTGLADKYGQFAAVDYPGKVHTDADFAAQRKAEAEDLAAHPAGLDRCRYGGWGNGPKLQATGFFRTEEYQGKWAFVDPDGHLFFSVGPDCVWPGQPSTVSGRESLFTWIPGQQDPLAFTRKADTNDKGEVTKLGVDYYKANLWRKYGEDWDNQWMAVTDQRLVSWGFNTIGNWSSGRFMGNSKVPYVATIHTGNDFPHLAGMADPWSKKFQDVVAKVVAERAAQVKGDPYCIGYFVDNEMPWAYDFDIAIQALKGKSADLAGKAAFVELLKKKYETIDALNAAWGTQVGSWDELAKPYSLSKEKPAKMKEDLSEFCKVQAVEYFTVVRDTIRKDDPNHLYLGCRFAHCTSEAYKAAVEVCDVVSFNVYQRGINPGEWGWLSDEKPTLIGEFHFGALDRGMFSQGMVSVGDQDARGQCFEQYVNSVLKNPKFIGCHWFSYSDEPLLGRPSDGENFNIGFLSVTDTPYPEMVAGARRVLSGMYGKRWGQG